MSTNGKKSIFQRIAERETAPETHLFKTVAFWLSIAPPLIIGAGLAIYAGIQEGKTWVFSTSGYNALLQDFKLPIGIMGLAIPLGALSAAVHRSVQTSRQIIEQNQQNIFSNYLEHRRYFLAFMDEHKPFNQVSVSAPHLYQRLFPESANGPLNPDKHSIYEFLKIAEETAEFSAQTVDRELSEKKFKIIDQRLTDCLIASNRTLQKFMPVADLDMGTFGRDPLGVLPQALTQNLDAAKGLVECANFHKNFIPDYDFNELEKNTAFCLNKIYSLQKLYNLWRMIWGEVSGELPSNRNQSLQSRLGGIKQNMEANRMNIDDLEIIFKYHLDDGEKQALIEYGPGTWKLLLNETKKPDGIE
ncbi:hypothetical protein [Marinobacter sp. SS13-12]|uniref:hypothetical protein n=1 Tax=Marinobacter sp. SS13-12 TaxID=3050451 RepID=UPI002556D0C5|nr:hypothetical protein [Marinobacter sp. SS13-12]MDK8463098.1 hypothetical protein [Marinobacter sp. SS13-12]